MKKIYKEPEVRFIDLFFNDVICTSEPGSTKGEVPNAGWDDID